MKDSGIQAPFLEVRNVFRRENPDPSYDATAYALQLLETANVQFGVWHRCVLSLKDMLAVMLPPHRHGGLELIARPGGLVSEAVKSFHAAPRDHICTQKIDKHSQEPSSTLFLSVAPLDDPQYSDYRDLVASGYRGLTHLDGLHRLIAYCRDNRTDVLAYIAG